MAHKVLWDFLRGKGDLFWVTSRVNVLFFWPLLNFPCTIVPYPLHPFPGLVHKSMLCRATTLSLEFTVCIVPEYRDSIGTAGGGKHAGNSGQYIPDIFSEISNSACSCFNHLQKDTKK